MDVGLYGYTRNTTPEIQRFAESGVVFDHAFANAPWTLPSHASMFTGRLPHELSTDFDKPLDGDAPTLAEVLSAEGYATAGFVGNLIFCTRASGLNRGFAVYRDYPIDLGALLASSHWTRDLAVFVRARLGNHSQLVRRTAEAVSREFLDWKPPAGHPFFAFINYINAHAPYETHAPFDRMFSQASPRYWLLQGWRRGYTRPELQEFRDAYDAAIAWTDHQIGQVLAELERRGVLDNTIVIIASDHGEHIGEHGIMSHANSLYLPLLQVPLVIRFPARAPAGVHVSEPVALHDLAATVLDLTGGSRSVALPGRSLATLWSGQPVAGAAGEPGILSELAYNTFANARDPIHRGPMRSLIRGSLHYIRNGDGVEQLFDWVRDPDEVIDLADSASSSEAVARMRRLTSDLQGSAVQSGSGTLVPSRSRSDTAQIR